VDQTSFLAACKTLDLELDEHQVQLFADFEERLYDANEVMNLTRVPREDCWLRHFIDSLLIHPLIPEGATVVDIGTGPGFPAWPLAVVRPDLQMTALDSSHKMLGFLAQIPLPNLKILNIRAEDWLLREEYDVVTGRAVAPFSAQMEISAGPAKRGGIVIPMRSDKDLLEIEDFLSDNAPPTMLKQRVMLGLELEMILQKPLPTTTIMRVFPVYRKVRPTAKIYPRRWAEIKGSPL
jgi:16S rRNA (guanine527-N7)-methyltransferase